MPPNKENRIITSFMIGITVVLFVFITLFMNVFTDSLWLNLQRVPMLLFGCFFLGNVIVGIPAFIFHFLTDYYFADFYELPKKKQRIIIAVLLVIICIIVTLIVTYL